MQGAALDQIGITVTLWQSFSKPERISISKSSSGQLSHWIRFQNNSRSTCSNKNEPSWIAQDWSNPWCSVWPAHRKINASHGVLFFFLVSCARKGRPCSSHQAAVWKVLVFFGTEQSGQTAALSHWTWCVLVACGLSLLVSHWGFVFF